MGVRGCLAEDQDKGGVWALRLSCSGQLFVERAATQRAGEEDR